MIRPFALQIFFDLFGKFINCQAKVLYPVIEPFARRLFIFSESLAQGLNDFIAPEHISVAFLKPYFAGYFLKILLEFFEQSFISQIPLDLGDLRRISAESLALIKNTGEDIEDRPIFLAVGLAVYIEENHFGVFRHGSLDVSQQQRVIYLGIKKIASVARHCITGMVRFAIFQQVRKNLDE